MFLSIAHKSTASARRPARTGALRVGRRVEHQLDPPTWPVSGTVRPRSL